MVTFLDRSFTRLATLCDLLMGSMSYYRHEITMWMQPELAQYDVAQETALKTAYQYLDVHAYDAKSWYIGVASEKSPVNNVYWQKQMVDLNAKL